MSKTEQFVDFSAKSAEGIATGLLFSAVPLLMMGLAIGVMKLLMRVPVELVGGE